MRTEIAPALVHQLETRHPQASVPPSMRRTLLADARFSARVAEALRHIRMVTLTTAVQDPVYLTVERSDHVNREHSEFLVNVITQL